MQTKTAFLFVMAASLSYADSYGTLLQRYESQIKQQERHLRSLRKNLLEKEQDAKRWQQKPSSLQKRFSDPGLK